MSTRIRSSSVGAKPIEKIHPPTRAESSAASPLEVRCGCQYFRSDSPPQDISPIGSRPTSRIDYYAETSLSCTRSRPLSQNSHDEISAINYNVNKPMRFSRADMIGGAPRPMPPQQQFEPNPIHTFYPIHPVTSNTPSPPPPPASDYQIESNNERIVPDDRMSPILFKRLSRFDQYKFAKKKG